MMRDPAARHQILLTASHSSLHVMVTCNCRVRAGLDAIGRTRDAAESGRLYNDAANHAEPFTVNDRLYRLQGST